VDRALEMDGVPASGSPVVPDGEADDETGDCGAARSGLQLSTVVGRVHGTDAVSWLTAYTVDGGYGVALVRGVGEPNAHGNLGGVIHRT
jgi:hypothetical protein